jgi:hypothetical protein
MPVRQLKPLPKVAVARHSSWESNMESYPFVKASVWS